MPKRTDIQKIMIIGSGPIVIGQACEFDYSGSQAAKALKEEGYEVVLVNSNPATIMTDPGLADRTYIEPIEPDTVARILAREKPDALLPTLGGQTGLNTAVALAESGILAELGVELIGASLPVIKKAESRELFRQAMENIGLKIPKSGICHTMDDVRAWGRKINFPIIVRPAYTLGGTGGGVAYNMEDLEKIAAVGLAASMKSEIMLEQSVLGWKEFELEVMRDKADNCVIICSIENIDPMGVHTGDSATVAPIQTLTDAEYQKMRDAAIAIMREIGVETGGSNVQFAVNPADGDMVIIEMNPRVSRSSALASKATGFPIAKIAAKLAVGYTLDEIPNDITRETMASFEPTIDYCVVKIPRFTFEKFPGSEDFLTTAMKSVGEAMSIGRNFKEALQKGLRSLEIGATGLGSEFGPCTLDRDELLAALRKPNSRRLFQVRQAMRCGLSLEEIFDATWIDPWFLRQIKELIDLESTLLAFPKDKIAPDNPECREMLAVAKRDGFSDPQIAALWGLPSALDARTLRQAAGIAPTYYLVDTCAAEFEAYTPYYYSTYETGREVAVGSARKVVILGGGPNRIGQGIEFDYCCVHACYALREAGFETLMVNSNPETVSTDYDTSDKLYFEPVTLEDVLAIYRREKCDGVIVQFGGQTPLNLAKSLQQNGVNIIGTSPESIEQAEDREFFKELADKVGVRQPENGTAMDFAGALAVARRIGFPVLVRPSFVLGGRAMAIVYDEASLSDFVKEAFAVSEDHPVLIDKFLEDAIEVDVDCIADGHIQVVGAIMEHVEKAGIHSGDSACSIPPRTLSPEVCDKIRSYTHALAKELNVVGLMNVQYAVQKGVVFIIEVNPRASRTVPYVSKAIGVPLARLAALVMSGKTLKELGFTREVNIRHYAFKEAVLPFNRFPGCDALLTPEMHSTGEVMGMDHDPGMAYIKSQLGAGNPLPLSGNVFLSVADHDKPDSIVMAHELTALGYTIYATRGTATALREAGIKARAVFRISEGRPNVMDLILDNEVQWIVNVPSGAKPAQDEVIMRTEAIRRGMPITTTIRGLQSAVDGIKRLRTLKRCEVLSLQEYNRKASHGHA